MKKHGTYTNDKDVVLNRNENILKKKTFNLGNQIKEFVHHYQWAIHEKGIMLSYSLPDIEVNGDPSLLNTVWGALQTCPPDSFFPLVHFLGYDKSKVIVSEQG